MIREWTQTIGGANGHRGQSDEHQPGDPTVGVDAKKKDGGGPRA